MERSMATEVTREAFLSERRKGIGGSDVAAIFGLDPYRSVEDLWLEKTGQVIPIDEPSGDKERGIRLEPVAAELYAEKYSRKLMRIPGVYVDRRYPWMRCNVDRIIEGRVVGSGLEMNRVAEIKCPSLGKYAKIQREGLGDSWKLQMQHMLRVTGLHEGVWIIFCADRWEMLDFPMERDEEVIQMLIEKEREFWTLVSTMTPPPPVVRSIAEEPEIVEVGSVTFRRDAEFVEAAAQLREAKSLMATAELLVTQAGDRVKELVGKPGIYEGPNSRIYLREQPGRTTFQKDKLAAARPLDRQNLLSVLSTLEQETKGQVYLSEIQLAVAGGKVDLDLDQFNKQGKPFTTLRPYFFGE